MAKSADTLIARREHWSRLEDVLKQINLRGLKNANGQALVELSDLYRSACADLAMAEQYRLSPETVSYLHGLVGRTHNAMYRSRRFQFHQWANLLFREAPRQIFQDRCVHVCAVLFFGLFAFAAYLAWNEETFPGMAERILGADQIEMMEEMYREVNFDSSPGSKLPMVGFYIQHNTGIGLKCFASGPLILPGLWTTAYNATYLGLIFGYMSRPGTEGGDNLLQFVTAHGAFELTAIALAAAAGLRIGMGWLYTAGLSRSASLRVQARRAVPIMSASGVLFIWAAFTEGIISPSSLPYLFKAMFGIASSALLMFYFVILGYPSEN